MNTVFTALHALAIFAAPPAIVFCTDDVSAIREATEQLAHQDIEIWEGKHVVAYLVAEPVEKKQSAG